MLKIIIIIIIIMHKRQVPVKVSSTMIIIINYWKDSDLLANMLEHVQSTSFNEYPVLCPNLVSKSSQLSSKKTGKKIKIKQVSSCFFKDNCASFD